MIVPALRPQTYAVETCTSLRSDPAAWSRCATASTRAVPSVLTASASPRPMSNPTEAAQWMMLVVRASSALVVSPSRPRSGSDMSPGATVTRSSSSPGAGRPVVEGVDHGGDAPARVLVVLGPDEQDQLVVGPLEQPHENLHPDETGGPREQDGLAHRTGAPIAW